MNRVAVNLKIKDIFVKNTFVKNKQNYNNMLTKNKRNQNQTMIKRQFHSFLNPPPTPDHILFICIIMSFYLLK
jgi:hypothetical protein